MSRDWTVPLRDDEIEEMKNKFCGMPSYKDGAIHSSDIMELCSMVGYNRTPQQMEVNKNYLEKQMGGHMQLEDFLAGLKVMHSTSKLARHRAQQADKDGNGYISAEEFKDLYELLKANYPNLHSVEYEEFVKQADTDKDGKVSIEECEKWIGSIST